jgi:hypothetical protein
MKKEQAMVDSENIFNEMDREVDSLFEHHIFSRDTDEGEDRLLAAIQVFASRLAQLTGMYLTLVHHLPEEMMDEQYRDLLERLKAVVQDDIATWTKRITETN